MYCMQMFSVYNLRIPRKMVDDRRMDVVFVQVFVSLKMKSLNMRKAIY